MYSISRGSQTAVYIRGPLWVSAVLVLDLSFVSRVESTMVWWWNSTFEARYDVVMKTAKVGLSCHMNIDFQADIYGTEIGSEVWQKPLIFFKIQSKKPLFYQK